ncbi:MAG: histidine phosphatase family protein [Candidatus Limnocylindrus sp.]
MKSAPIRARFLVVRHGQSLWNIEQRWQGRADIDLSEHGIAQARAAATKLGGFDFIASSNLRRALDTAHIIAEHHGVGPVHVDERLRETHVGPWEGLTVHEIEQGWPGFLAARRKPEGFEPDDSINADTVAPKLVIAGSVNSVVDQILALREEIGDFGTLLYAGHDWKDPALAKRSMQLMAEQVMPKVNAAIGA